MARNKEPELIKVTITKNCLGEGGSDLQVGEVTELKEDLARQLIWSKKAKHYEEGDEEKALAAAKAAKAAAKTPKAVGAESPAAVSQLQQLVAEAQAAVAEVRALLDAAAAEARAMVAEVKAAVAEAKTVPAEDPKSAKGK